MRPARFTGLLAEAVNHDGHLAATLYVDQASPKSLWGITISGSVDADVQIVARSAPDDDYTQPEMAVTGPKRGILPRSNPSNLSTLEGYLVARAVDVAAAEVKSVYRYTARRKPGAVKYGATFTFYDGSAIFLYIWPR